MKAVVARQQAAERRLGEMAAQPPVVPAHRVQPVKIELED